MKEYQFASIPVREQLVCDVYRRKIGLNTNMIHMHNAQELILITSRGRVRTVSNGVDFMVDTPAVIMNRQGAFHAIAEVHDQPLDGYVCFFHNSFFQLMPKENYGQSLFDGQDLLILPLTQSQCDTLSPLVKWLSERPMGERRYLLLCVFEQLKALLGGGGAPVRATCPLTYVFEVARLLQQMQSRENLTLTGLATRFHVGQTKLKSDFKKITGTTLHAFRRRAQLQEARILLEGTELSISQVSAQSDFKDEGYFIRAFRQEYGMTPGTYRKRWRMGTV